MLLEDGEAFAGFTVRSRLGHGGDSGVYLVHDPATGEPRALKVLEDPLPVSAAVRGRFAREFEIADSLRHPHIVRVFAHGEHRGRLWMTLQYVDGATAAALVPRPRRAPAVLPVLDALEDVAAALDHAHAHEVVHRDVKPSNILLGQHREVVLTDFGIAQLLDDRRPVARNGRVQGSLPYAAPETLQAHRLGPATDLYSLACTLTELLTGRPPYPRATAFGIANAHLSSPPPRLSRRQPWLPGTLDEVVARGLAKRPEDRPASCGAFLAEVSAALEAPSPRIRHVRAPWRPAPVRRA